MGERLCLDGWLTISGLEGTGSLREWISWGGWLIISGEVTGRGELEGVE